MKRKKMESRSRIQLWHYLLKLTDSHTYITVYLVISILNISNSAVMAMETNYGDDPNYVMQNFEDDELIKTMSRTWSDNLNLNQHSKQIIADQDRSYGSVSGGNPLADVSIWSPVDQNVVDQFESQDAPSDYEEKSAKVFKNDQAITMNVAKFNHSLDQTLQEANKTASKINDFQMKTNNGYNIGTKLKPTGRKIIVSSSSPNDTPPQFGMIGYTSDSNDDLKSVAAEKAPVSVIPPISNLILEGNREYLLIPSSRSVDSHIELHAMNQHQLKNPNRVQAAISRGGSSSEISYRIDPTALGRSNGVTYNGHLSNNFLPQDKSVGHSNQAIIDVNSIVPLVDQFRSRSRFSKYSRQSNLPVKLSQTDRSRLGSPIETLYKSAIANISNTNIRASDDDNNLDADDDFEPNESGSSNLRSNSTIDGPSVGQINQGGRQLISVKQKNRQQVSNNNLNNATDNAVKLRTPGDGNFTQPIAAVSLLESNFTQVFVKKQTSPRQLAHELLVGPFKSEAEAPTTITLEGVVYQKSGSSLTRLKTEPSSAQMTNSNEKDALTASGTIAASVTNNQQHGQIKTTQLAIKQWPEFNYIKHGSLSEISTDGNNGNSFNSITKSQGPIDNSKKNPMSNVESDSITIPLNDLDLGTLSSSLRHSDQPITSQGSINLADQLGFGQTISNLQLINNRLVPKEKHLSTASKVTSPTYSTSSSSDTKDPQAEKSFSPSLNGMTTIWVGKDSQKMPDIDTNVGFLASASSSDQFSSESKQKEKSGPIVIVQKNVKPVKYHLLRAYLKLRRLLRPSEATYVFPNDSNGIFRRWFNNR